jgi:hypothetical protein
MANQQTDGSRMQTKPIMTIENAKLDATHHLIDPNVGDGELVKIEFKHPNLVLEIKLDPTTGRRACVIEIVRCRYLSCETDHPQNVVDGLVIAPKVEHLTRPIADDVKRILESELKSRAGLIVQVEPLTGIELICLGDDICVEVLEAESGAKSYG